MAHSSIGVSTVNCCQRQTYRRPDASRPNNLSGTGSLLTTRSFGYGPPVRPCGRKTGPLPDFIFLTAMRSGAAAETLLSWVRDGAVYFPGTVMKSGEPHRVPLSPRAWGTNRRRRSQTGRQSVWWQASLGRFNPEGFGGAQEGIRRSILCFMTPDGRSAHLEQSTVYRDMFVRPFWPTEFTATPSTKPRCGTFPERGRARAFRLAGSYQASRGGRERRQRRHADERLTAMKKETIKRGVWSMSRTIYEDDDD